MSYYSKLVEKIEKQNSSSLKDRLESHYQIKEMSAKLHAGSLQNNKLLKIIIMLQIINTTANNYEEMLVPLIKLIM